MQSTVQKGRRYICQNPACRKKIETVRNHTAENDGILQCTCGGVMIRVYSKPALRELTETEATALRESLELPKPSRS